MYIPGTEAGVNSRQNTRAKQIKTDKIGQACSSFSAVQATLAKFALHTGNVRLSTQNKD
jgi:hypothetical protein